MMYGMQKHECRWLRSQGMPLDLIDIVCPPLMPFSEAELRLAPSGQAVLGREAA